MAAGQLLELMDTLSTQPSARCPAPSEPQLGTLPCAHPAWDCVPTPWLLFVTEEVQISNSSLSKQVGKGGKNASLETTKMELHEAKQCLQPAMEGGWAGDPCQALPCPPRLVPAWGCLGRSPAGCTLPSCRSESEQASMKAWAITDRQASMWSVLSMSNTNCGFFRMFTQNLSGRLQREGSRDTHEMSFYVPEGGGKCRKDNDRKGVVERKAEEMCSAL